MPACNPALGSMLDVGASYGNQFIFFSEFFDCVMSLVPNPRVFEFLSINARLGQNIVPVPLGATN